jgi:hypothetical protein
MKKLLVHLKTILGILVIIVYFTLVLLPSEVFAEELKEPFLPMNVPTDNTNNSGDNVDGGNQDGSLNSNTQNSSVNSNNNTNSKTYNGAGSSGMPPYSAIAPTYMSTGPETCFRGNSQALQLPTIGLSRGSYKEDPNCNRRRDAKILSDLGMKVAAVARMCQEPGVWRAMFISGTPCPIMQSGKLVVGKRAYLALKQRPELHIPDYKKQKDWYNKVLSIGETQNEQATDTDSRSISERYRSSTSGSPE